MYVPQKSKDGLRRYGTWSGNPNGVKEKTERCVVQVRAEIGWVGHQCKRPRGSGPDGEYCSQHAISIAKRA